MKKSLFTAFCAVLLSLTAAAQNDGELTRAKALWFESDNASGLLCDSLGKFNTAGLSYSYETGAYRMIREGQNVGTLNFDTQGAVKVGKIQIWGRFSYDNVTDKGSQYNCIVYDPADERYIYGVADTTASTWKRQCYDMEFKLALPFVENRLLGGLSVRYMDKIAAKQHDPRTESYNYEINVKPSLALLLGDFTLGLDASYSHCLERSVPTRSNTQLDQSVFLLRGLGNYTDATVGTNGLDPMFYTTNLYGGAFQFAYTERSFLQLGVDWSETEVRQSATSPRPMGKSSILKAVLDASLVLGQENCHKLSLNAELDDVSGTEYSTRAETGVGWVIATETVMSTYLTAAGSLAYDGWLMGGDSWKWKFHADAGYTYKKDRYLSPVSLYTWSAIDLNASADRRWLIHDKHILCVGLSASGVLGLDGEYSYQGTRGESRVVTEWYPHDLAVRTAQAYGGGASVDWGIITKNKMEVHLAAEASSLFSTLNTSRTLALAKLYLVF